MKTIFTPHAGEFLVGERIERMRGLNLWIPSKDDGVDLLVTDEANQRSCSLQVKFSRDYSDTHDMPDLGNDHVVCSGFFKLNHQKIKTSVADYWILIICGAKQPNKKLKVEHVIIKPKNLLAKLENTHGNLKDFKLYIAVTKERTVLDWRGLKSKAPLPSEVFRKDSSRNYTEHLEDWNCLERLQ